MKPLIFFLAVILMISANVVFSQVGINNDGFAPDNSSMLDVKSVDKGLLVPRMTQEQRNNISSPSKGLMIFQTDQTEGFYYYNGTTWTALTCSIGSGHYVGELFGGGVVFLIDQTGQHGLICSMIDLSTSQAWSNVTNALIGATAQSEWNGQGNTNSIIGQSSHNNSAAKLCDDYTNADYGTGIFSDWYLPARGELNHLWNNLYEVQKALDSDDNSATTALFKTYYWSSTEWTSSLAWNLYFGNSSTGNYDKYETFYVRAVRAF